MSDLSDAQRLYKANRFEEAERIAREVNARERENADALNVIAMCALMTNRSDEAMPLLERIVQIKPKYARARTNLAGLLFRQKRYAEAEFHARQVIEVSPNLAQAHATLGRALAEQGKKIDAMISLARAIEVEPNHAEALYWLGFIHSDANRYDLASQYFQRVLQIQPANLDAIYALAFAQRSQGLLEDALATYRRGMEIAPTDSQLHSAYLFSLVYRPTIDGPTVAEESAIWFDRHARSLMTEARSSVPRDAKRPLRIGFVSPYFREHSVAFFIEPILANHDRANFRIVIYSDVEFGDAVTERLKKLADEWRDTRGLSDTQLADLVQQDRIDILIDLTQHSGGSRLLAFARKPAPVQASYLGYPMPTGLPTIDYRISDQFLDPVDREDRTTTFERVARLPESYFCYQPPTDAPDVSPNPPREKSGVFTFVSQNALVKLNEQCVALWSRTMHAVPDSRLIIKAAGCGSESARKRYTSMFESFGIASARIEFRPHTPLPNLMSELADADIALDTIAYNGGTTTCHILWMGVPVVSLAGELPIHRMGISVLSQIGLSDLVARSEAEFVAIANKLANDVARLRELRQTMRRRMLGSLLMDGSQFTTGFESLLRKMWCEP